MKKEKKSKFSYRDWIVNRPKIRISFIISFVLISSLIFVLPFFNILNELYNSVILIWILFVVSVPIIFFLLYQRDKKRGIEIIGYKKRTKNNIWEGWLALLTLSLVFTSLKNIIFTLVLLLSVLFNYIKFNYNFIITFIISLAISFFFIYTIVCEIKKRKEFPKLAIIAIWLEICSKFLIADLLSNANISIEYWNKEFIALLLIAIVWTVYLLKSKKVRTVFMN